ncbi:hypothetical protein DSECCO2_318850 [anaerobic digester metagenome]
MNLDSYRWANVAITFKIISNESHSINVAFSRKLRVSSNNVPQIGLVTDYRLISCRKASGSKRHRKIYNRIVTTINNILLLGSVLFYFHQSKLSDIMISFF